MSRLGQFGVGVDAGESGSGRRQGQYAGIPLENRGPEAATLHVLPTLWFRNEWTWSPDVPKPALRQVDGLKGSRTVAASHAELGERWLWVDGDVPLLFTENETNNQRLFGTANAGAYVKDGIRSGRFNFVSAVWENWGPRERN